MEVWKIWAWLLIVVMFINLKANDNGKKIIINLGLPKSGGQLINSGLSKLGISTVNWNSPHEFCPDSSFPVANVTVGGIDVPKTFYPTIQRTTGCSVCIVMQRTVAEGLPPFHYFTESNITSFLQMECILTDTITNKTISIWPQFQMLDELYKFYPSAYFIRTRRASAETHVESLIKWRNLLNRMEDIGLLNSFQGQSKNNSQIENTVIFVNQVNEIVYNSTQKHPYIKFLDVCVDCHDFNISQELIRFLDLPEFEMPPYDWGNKSTALNIWTNASHDGGYFSFNNCSLSDYNTFISDTLSSPRLFDTKTCKVDENYDGIKDNGCKAFQLYRPHDAIILLNGSTIHAVGDSITRRLFNHLHQYILGLAFTDAAVHDNLNLSINLNSSIINIFFYWAPTISNKIMILQNLVSDARIGSQHFIHVGGPNHDFAYAEADASPKNFYASIIHFNETINKLKSLGAFITLDGVLQFDSDPNTKQFFKSTYEIVAANGFYSSVYCKQNYFGYIDMWQWVQLESRKHCMTRDYSGIHFINDDVRLLHVQAFLNYFNFFKNVS